MYPISLSSSLSLRIRLASSSATANPTFLCTYVDTAVKDVVTNKGVLDDTEYVTVADSPFSGNRIIRQLVINNLDTASVTIIYELYDGIGTEIIRLTLGPGEIASFNKVYKTDGTIKAGFKGDVGEQGIQGETGSVSAASGLILEHVASPPSTDAEETALFVDIADGKLYQRAENDGAVTEIGSGVGGSGGPIDLVEVMFYT
jgi:hypothetical protein